MMMTIVVTRTRKTMQQEQQCILSTNYADANKVQKFPKSLQLCISRTKQEDKLRHIIANFQMQTLTD